MKKKYKISILLALLFINCNLMFSLPPGWQEVYRRPDYSTEGIFSLIMKLVCADSNNCMVYGSLYGNGGYYIDRTTDGGKTWKRVHQDTGYSRKTDNNFEIYYGRSIIEMSYPDTNLFIAVVDSGLYSTFLADGKTRIDSVTPRLYLKSTDRGLTWSDTTFGKNKSFSRPVFLNKNYGMMGISNKPWDTTRYLHYTTDGGRTWIAQNMPLSLLTKIYWYQTQIIDSDLFISSIDYIDDKGKYNFNELLFVYYNWENWYILPCNDSLWFKYFLDEKRGWASGGYFDPNDYNKTKQLIKYTSDGGITWITQRDTNWRNCVIREVVFYDENFGMAGSAEGLVLRTTNGGKTWNEDIFEQDTNWAFFWRTESVQVPSPTTAYLIYDGTYIMKYTWEGIPESVEEPAKKTDFIISPNPAGEYIEINVEKSLRHASTDKINIYNTIGKCVLSEKIHPITQSYRMNIEHLPSGIYYVRLGDWVGRFVKIE